MAEFKVTDALTSQIEAFRTAGGNVNDGYAKTGSDGVDTLQTAKAYISQQEAIYKLLVLYDSLVQKDAKDLDDMVAAAKALDEKLAASSR